MDPGAASSLLTNQSAGGTGHTAGIRSSSVPVKILLETIMVLMCVAAITGNVLVIAIIAVTKHFHSVTSVFLVNLAVSDCLVGLGVMPFVAMSVFYQDWNRYNDLCLYVGYTSSVYCTASVLTLAAIALDRYHAIIDCLQYNSQSTVRRTAATVVWIWLQSALSSCPPLLGWGRFGYSPALRSCSVAWADSLSYTGFVVVFSFLLPASVMIFCYVRIVGVARGHAKRIHDIENQLQRRPQPRGPSPADRPTFSQLISSVNSPIISEHRCEEARGGCCCCCRRRGPGLQPRGPDIFCKGGGGGGSPGRGEHHGAFRLFMVIFAFFCCWVPYEVVGLVQAVEAAVVGGRRASSVPPGLVTAAHWLALLNSDINPLLYALLSRRFRKALRHWQRRLEAKVGLGRRSRREGPAAAAGLSALLHPKPAAGQGGRSSSNATNISQLSPHQPPGLQARSCSVFSISGPDEALDGLLSGPASASSLVFVPCGRAPERRRDQQGEPLPKQYLKVPQLPPEADTMLLPSQTFGEKQSSTYVFGNIIVKVENDAVDL
ncbi:probable G-protein coupled receptor No9 [Pristis pectinata]|uniref:probable G-protein coupled receptor No9 n=1 Tax=Pristis pectinata TaxID=685728 RepID=UPI00223D26FF|nr:probable G-protein coupled receptor No9 [Pristis pectinata]